MTARGHRSDWLMRHEIERAEMPRQPLEGKSSHSRSPGLTGTVVLVLQGLYIAAYFSFVSRIVPSSTWVPSRPALPSPAAGWTVHTPYGTSIPVEPFYNVPAGIPQALPQLVFYPAHQIDHWLRPSYWSFADALPATPVPPPPGSP